MKKPLIIVGVVSVIIAIIAVSVLNSDSTDTVMKNNTPDSSISPLSFSNLITSDTPLKGDPSAPITLIEFGDFQCSNCGRFYTNTLPLIEKNFINTGKVNFVYRDFPIQSIHLNAVPAAIAAECVDDQNSFWSFHDMVFENKSTWGELNEVNLLNEFEQYAVTLELNTEEFNVCLESKKYLDEVRNDLQDGRNYGVKGTGFFIGNEKIGFTKVSGAKPYPIFEEILEGMLAQ